MYNNENEPSSLTIGLYTCTQKNVAHHQIRVAINTASTHRFFKYTSSQHNTQRWSTKLSLHVALKHTTNVATLKCHT